MKIFWSWQSDHDPKTGHYFVRDALASAAKELGKELDLEEAERLEVDHDTKGVPGTPPVVETIFNKIEEAAVFVADVTPVGRSDGGTKVLPNPNVMIELGYARRARGYERLILVANGHILEKIEHLPFDMRGDRGPIVYTLASDADTETRKAVQKELVSKLKTALKACIEFDKREQAALALTSLNEAADMRTKWFEDDARLNYIDTYHPNATTTVHFPPGPHAFMRIQPAIWPDDVRTASLAPNGNGTSLLIGRGPTGNWGQTEGGMLHFLFHGQQDSRNDFEANTIIHWFAESGTIWAVWSAIVSDDSQPWFYGQAVMQFWGRLLNAAVLEITKHGGEGPFRIDAGVVGIRGARWAMPRLERPLYAASGETRRTTTDVTAETATQHRYLASLFNRLTDMFGFDNEIPPSQVPAIMRG